MEDELFKALKDFAKKNGGKVEVHEKKKTTLDFFVEFAALASDYTDESDPKSRRVAMALMLCSIYRELASLIAILADKDEEIKEVKKTRKKLSEEEDD